jgi:hypothetical protein
MEIMMLYSQYISSLILFSVKNKHLSTSNNEIHTYKTRDYLNFHLPTVNLTKFYKGPYILGTKAFNQLPPHIKILVNDMCGDTHIAAPLSAIQLPQLSFLSLNTHPYTEPS